MISQSNIGENTILRPVIANPSVGKETIDNLVDEITKIGMILYEHPIFKLDKLRFRHDPVGKRIGGMLRENSCSRMNYLRRLLRNTLKVHYMAKAICLTFVNSIVGSKFL